MKVPHPKQILRLAMIAPITLVGIPLQWAAVRTSSRAAKVIPQMYHRMLCRILGVRLVVRGERVKNRAALIVANHVSWLDIPVISAAAPVSFIAKAEVGTWPVVGLLARLQRTVFIDRTRRAATAATNTMVASRLGRGDAVVLFPEGTTGDGIRILPFRSSLVGAVRDTLTGDGEAPVSLQPLTITYARRGGLPLSDADQAEIAWYGDMDLAPHLGAILKGAPIDVILTWGDPITVDARTDRKSVTRLAEAQVRAAMRAARAARGVA